MKKNELLEKIAPCSLMCHTCSAYEHGVISQTAKQLSKYTEGICEFYEKHSPNELERFKVFQEELQSTVRVSVPDVATEKIMDVV